MGVCSSKNNNKKFNVNQTMETLPLSVRLFKSKKIKIKNESSVHCKIIITPAPIDNIEEISIDKIGKFKKIRIGDFLVQHFKILSNKEKKIKLDTCEYYITSYLLINREWKCLWECREFTDSTNIKILERHIEEALLV